MPTSVDPLAPLLALPGVAEAAEAAGAAIAEVHRHRANRRGFPVSATEASVRAARASATLDGGAPELPAEDSDGQVADPVLAGAVRVAAALDGPALASTVRVWERAPLQVLARLHVLAAADLAIPETLGRPRPDPAVAERLDLLAQLVTGGTRAPAAVLAAVTHGELLAVAPFGTADGVVARAASRLVAVSTGLDPKNLTVPEVSWMRRPADYREVAAGFATGSTDGVTAWVLHCCAALQDGAREASSIADAHNG